MSFLLSPLLAITASQASPVKAPPKAYQPPGRQPESNPGPATPLQGMPKNEQSSPKTVDVPNRYNGKPDQTFDDIFANIDNKKQAFGNN
ncbi:uncharacterized protein FA14DRAFT_188810 [Meira miltonrushii]|uniref:Uncharacterized protein n=1 Tax=Meira miltonrushii TaxID=1280837 RepID=A0A316VB86_9BASI|nr:uncharacterized protein FA14DRAFT_188810 [Meira miltonrushii]PWN34750.1 hypothetical protein FA14DRAFT_188810 [Meira miltonrushii]